jgi:uncharacterized membrane protein (UPF0182 family)
VIVTYNDRSVLEPTLGQALAKLFPGFSGDLGEQLPRATEPTGSDPSPTDPTTTDPGSSSSDDPAALLSQADDLFAEADDALAAGDLGLYQEKIDEARKLIADAVEILSAQP